MAHPEDKGRCLLDGYFHCASIIDAGCICNKMPPEMAKELYRKKFGNPNEEANAKDLLPALQ